MKFLLSKEYKQIATILNSIMDILSIMVSERNQLHKSIYFMIPLKSNKNKGHDHVRSQGNEYS